MNRRGFLTALAAAPVAAVPIAAAAKDDEYKDKYWEAQRHIDELYEKPQFTIHNASDQDLVIEPGQLQFSAMEMEPRMTFWHDGNNRAEVYFCEKTKQLVMENMVTGKVIRV